MDIVLSHENIALSSHKCINRCHQVPWFDSCRKTRAWYWSTPSWHSSPNSVWLLCRVPRDSSHCVLGCFRSWYPQQLSSSGRFWCSHVRIFHSCIQSMMTYYHLYSFRLINEDGESNFVKFHWKPLQGLSNMLWVCITWQYLLQSTLLFTWSILVDK